MFKGWGYSSAGQCLAGKLRSWVWLLVLTTEQNKTKPQKWMLWKASFNFKYVGDLLILRLLEQLWFKMLIFLTPALLLDSVLGSLQALLSVFSLSGMHSFPELLELFRLGWLGFPPRSSLNVRSQRLPQSRLPDKGRRQVWWGGNLLSDSTAAIFRTPQIFSFPPSGWGGGECFWDRV